VSNLCRKEEGLVRVWKLARDAHETDALLSFSLGLMAR